MKLCIARCLSTSPTRDLLQLMFETPPATVPTRARRRSGSGNQDRLWRCWESGEAAVAGQREWARRTRALLVLTPGKN